MLTHMYTHVCMNTHMHTQTCTHIHTHTCTHIHMHTHTHTRHLGKVANNYMCYVCFIYMNTYNYVTDFVYIAIIAT